MEAVDLVSLLNDVHSRQHGLNWVFRGARLIAMSWALIRVMVKDFGNLVLNGFTGELE